ncbi:hypothetical protein SODALDRAFT_350497 [Sodiomyces alkalinus F11]|uniref:Autophagy-related protein 14 n=1 Tax=Sodiomyces alkalinus (strain CBS 110278 / VKM F-3762 / F11) TaxID=1314773 RepID=A0A3N2PXS0_SODAK|nr:hypothetical protein SODALDRAFT_350497 [Sodiomyces alkalinus F11]ROT39333.1 hypothetical protein SODALDRAFT_350497 [Sodiomyces alkalinus F11]
MNCDICSRSYDTVRLPFLCPVDARNHCYDGRLKHATLLLQNETLQKQISKLAEDQTTDDKFIAKRDAVSETRAAQDRTSRIIEQADKLRHHIAAAREEMEDRKAAIARRRSDLASATNGLAARRARQLDDVERSIQAAKFKWNRNADAMAKTRAFLCLEAARLFGLRRVKTGSSSSSRYQYKIGGVDIFDLESMHAASPEQLSTSLANVAHILALAAHYLSLRLPAEPTLPHCDYPRPTIFTLASSYQHGKVPFPGSAAIPGFGADYDLAQHLPVPRPRPLYVDKALPALAKEDPSVYSLFLEGVTLLAYDVAWVCNTQGVSVGDRTSFDDVCRMGRNLYTLLIGQQIHGAQAARTYAPPTMVVGKSEAVDHQEEIGQAASLMGRYSHGAAHTFLCAADGIDFARSFKLPNPLKLVDRLKRKLVSEVAIPEWEVLEEDEWAGGDDALDGGSVVNVAGPVSRQEGETKTSKTDNVPASSQRGPRSGSGSGTSGWTKVKSR